MNENQDAEMLLASLVDQGARLRFVECFFDKDLPKGPVAVRFEFENASLCLAVDASDDTILVADTCPSEYRSALASSVDDSVSPWDAMLGSELTSAWVLTNQQGYRDGAQLEFRNIKTNIVVCIQLIAIASTLELRAVVRDQFVFRGAARR